MTTSLERLTDRPSLFICQPGSRMLRQSHSEHLSAGRKGSKLIRVHVHHPQSSDQTASKFRMCRRRRREQAMSAPHVRSGLAAKDSSPRCDLLSIFSASVSCSVGFLLFFSFRLVIVNCFSQPSQPGKYLICHSSADGRSRSGDN